MSKTVLTNSAALSFGRNAADTLAAAGNTDYASIRYPHDRNAAPAEAPRAQGIKVIELGVANDSWVNCAIALLLAEAGVIEALGLGVLAAIAR